MLSVFLAGVAAAQEASPLPLMFVPGISGTGLLSKLSSDYVCRKDWEIETSVGNLTGTYDEAWGDASSGWYRTWLTMDLLRPPATHQECWFRAMRLVYSRPFSPPWASLGHWTTPDGVEVTTDPGVHGVDYLDYIAGYGISPTRYFHDLIQSTVRIVSAEFHRLNARNTTTTTTATPQTAAAQHDADDEDEDDDDDDDDDDDAIQVPKVLEPVPGESVLVRLEKNLARWRWRFRHGIYKTYPAPSSLHFADDFVGSYYARDVNVTAFGYDWRMPVWQLDWQEFSRRVESTFRAGGRRPVVLIAHSMGSLWLNYFFLTHATEEWKRTYVRAVISINGANGGSFKAIRALISGYSPLNSTWLNYFKIQQMLPLKSIRDLGRSFPSVFSLLPHEQIYGADAVAFKLQAPEGETRTYTLKNWTNAVDDEEIVNQIDVVRHTLGDVGLRDPGVEYYCLYSLLDGPQTEFRFFYESFDQNPDIASTWGDGTIPAPSLAFCRNWPSTKMIRVFRGLDHMFALRDNEVASAVSQIVIKLSRNHAVNWPPSRRIIG